MTGWKTDRGVKASGQAGAAAMWKKTVRSWRDRVKLRGSASSLSGRSRRKNRRGFVHRSRLHAVQTALRTMLRSMVEAIGRHPKTVMVFVWVTLMTAAIVVIPTVLVERGLPDEKAGGRLPDIAVPSEAATRSAEVQQLERPISFPIYLTKEKRITSVTLEQYVRGVVAAEMPIEFELEALKAQAIAARTYIVRRFVTKDVSNVPVEGAWVTDSVQHQAYLTDEAIAKKWDQSVRAANLEKLTQAVEETRGQILTYEGEPILAAFFSTSNGYTENSEDYWSDKLPYLRSVQSPWEAAISPKFETTITMSAKEFAGKLGIRQNKASQIQILEQSEGKRIKKVKIGGVTFTGRDVREKLSLPSTEFTITPTKGEFRITVRGNGHGVGMSQWGAQGMALKGYRADQILGHYYSGVQIEKFRPEESIL